MTDSTEKLQRELQAAQRDLAEARARCERHDAEHQVSVKELEENRSALLFMLEDLEEGRKQIEQAHREWVAALDVVNDPIFLHDKQFRILRCNKAYQRCAGIPFHELIGQPYYEVFPKTGAPLSCCLMAMNKAEEEEEEVAVGDAFYRSRAFSIHDEQGVHLYSVHTLENITENKRAEAALHESEEKFRKISEAAQDGIIMMADKQVSFWNAAAERIFGYTAAEALGQELHALIVPPPAHAKFAQAFPHFQQSGEGPIIDKVIEVTALRKGGEEFPVELSVSATQFGGQWHAIGIVRDITERKRAEQNLKKSEALLNEMGRLAKVGGWEFNVETRDMIWTEEVYRIHELDTTYKPTVDKGIEFYAPASRPIIAKVVQRAIEYGEPYDVELEFITAKGNHRWVHAKGNVYQEHGKTITVFGTFQDITELKQAERKLLETNQLLSCISKSQAQFITESDPMAAFGKVLDQLLVITESEYGFIAETLYDDKGVPYIKDFAISDIAWNRITRELSKKASTTGLEFRNMNTLFGAVVTSGKPVIANDPANDPQSGGLPEGHPPINTFLGIPFYKGEEQAGIFAVANRPGGYDEKLVEYIRPFTETLANLVEFVRGTRQRKQAEIALGHASRALAALSAANKSLVRAGSEDELFQSICQAIIKQRGYRMAWVGYKQHDEDKSIKVMARAGHDEGYLDAMQLTWAEAERGMGPSGRAIRSGTAQLCQDMLNDPSYLPWRDAASQRGYASDIALPLTRESGDVFGILHVYSEETNAFSPAEIDLLEEMAGDLSFGVRSLLIRHERDLAQDKIQQQLAQLQDSMEGTVRAIATIVEMRDPYTSGHQVRVADLASAISTQMGLPDEQVHAIHLAGVVHDLGKIQIPAEILSKPGRITDIEFSLIKIHPQSGYDILKGINFPWPIAQMVLQHHERLDGSGYPQGLRGDAILLEARILSVADVVEAMSSHRPYRPGLGVEVALAEITRQRGIYFDPVVVDACLALFHEQHYSFK